MDASFVARAFIGDRNQTKEIMKKAIKHKGFALVDIFQPCVTYNRVNTFKWFKENTYYLDDSYDPTDQIAAIKKSLETEKLPLGVLYVNRLKPTFEAESGVYEDDKTPLHMRDVDVEKLSQLIDTLKDGI